MKNTIGKILAICLIIAVFVSIGIPAYADGALTGKITVTGTGEGIPTFYKVIDIDMDKAGNVIEPTWNSAAAEWVRTNYSGYIGTEDNTVTEAFASASAADLKGFAAAIAAAVKSGTITITGTTTNTGLAVGEYLILVAGGVNIYNPMLAPLQPVYDEESGWTLSDAEIGAGKYTTPTIDKKVKLPADTVYAETAQCSIGDTVDYEIIATVPSYPSTASCTLFEIGDKLTNQTLASGSVTVYGISGSNETKLTGGYTVSTNTATANGTSVDLLVVPAYDSIKGYDSIKVTCSATLDAAAVIGPDGNANDAYLDYTNDPFFNGAGDPPAEELTDDAAVFSYGIDITKKDKAEDKALSGAQFSVKLGNDALKFRQDAASKVYYPDANGSATVVESDTNGKINIKGLEAGTYTFTETKAPAEYSLPRNATTTVTIEAVKDTTTGEFNGQIKGFDNGVYAQTILNSKGATLPQTGSAGEVILIAVSALFAVFAVAFYIIGLKKKNSEEEA